LNEMMDTTQSAPKHFFISYTKADRSWAEWIAWQLEADGYRVVLQAWDFRPGSNFVLDMDDATKQAERSILVLSPDYVNSDFTQPEWAEAFRRDPRGKQRTIIPIQVRRCELSGLLAPIVYVDLVGCAEPEARERLLAAIHLERAKPTTAPAFPGDVRYLPTEPPCFPGILWTVPYQRNPFFTGQDSILAQLHTTLAADDASACTQPRAISGLGGIGKTHIAIEYAYRHRNGYHALLWARADSREALVLDYVALAGLLGLAGKDDPDQPAAVAAVKSWLRTHDRWLLILDNVDDMAVLDDFLPVAPKGHILLTTRAQAHGTRAHGIAVPQLSPVEGALLLLRRAKALVPGESLEQAREADRSAALELARMLAGLPLALDQAGAYIEETGCGVAGYVHRYLTHRTVLLQRRGTLACDHPEPVASTWSLSFEKIEQANPVAADLLRLCAFLHPDAIPEELCTEGISDLSAEHGGGPLDQIDLDGAIAVLCHYSFLSRNADTQTLSMHRLVQTALQDAMSEEHHHQWAERAVRIVEHPFPDPKDPTTWAYCKRYILHVQTCTLWITHWKIVSHEAIQLLNRAGVYLDDTGQYREAEQFYQQSLLIHEQVTGCDHPDTAASLNNLATLSYKLGNYERAESLFQRALAIDERTVGPDHPATARSLNNLAYLYLKQGKYEQAEGFFQRALAIRERELGAHHPDTAVSLNTLAELYSRRGQHEQAEAYFRRVLAIREQTLGPNHPGTARSLNNLAYHYNGQGKYVQAEPLVRRALAIQEQVLDHDHPDIAATLNNRAVVCIAQGSFEEAEALYQRALAIHEQKLGPEHSATAHSLNNLGQLYRQQGRFEEAEPLLKRALLIQERAFGANHPDLADQRESYTTFLEERNGSQEQ